MIKKFIILLSLFIITILGLLQFPGLFLDKKIEYKSFELYSKDPINPSQELHNILDSVLINLKRSQFYQDDQIFELYFIGGSFYERLVKLFGANHLASAQYNKHLYFGKPNFKQGKLLKGLDKHEWANLVQLISHEAVHSQMYIDYSSFGIMKTPSWINEGYCEYISYFPKKKNAAYELFDLYSLYKESSNYWVQTEHGSMTPRIYLRDRIIMEYLIDYKQINILEVIASKNLNPENLLKEIDLKALKNKNQ